MIRIMFKSKIHRATVTQADLSYEGSITIDRDLLKASNILPYEEVHLWNVTNGNRITTYALEGDVGVICVNGAAAHHFDVGDLIIITTFTQINNPKNHKPSIILVDEFNNIISAKYEEIPGPFKRN